MSDPLFEIREEQLETGMRGYPVGYCVTSKVDPEKGLFYRGIPVSSLVNESSEKVIYLLYHGREPSPSELETFSNQLKKRSEISSDLYKQISKLPQKGHPMALFSAAILLLGTEALTGEWQEDCLNLIAKLPTVGAAVINHHANFGKQPKSHPELGYVENFAQMLKVPQTETLLEVLKLFMILHLDHGGGNLSTFVGKAVASGLEDLYGSISSAMNALAGPLHGRANQECLHFVQEMVEALGDDATEESVEEALRTRLKNKELIYGFGHAVLRVEDPRATVFYELAEKSFPDSPLVKMALLLRTVGSKVLKENPKIADPYTNIDAISGSILTAAGFPYPEYYTILFGVSRSIGISIQIVYERCYAREGKGTPIIRPKYIFKD
ncbi:MAG: Citrate synthase [Chlamydiales bacterium]|nr:Citrate synthase [Chlamydiales bacterium]MCH9620577.1 Citrate synthase [Chlamydiales bacterium]MCH9623551.1 Citrate synthase [Chlamydiales bacterium]